MSVACIDQCKDNRNSYIKLDIEIRGCGYPYMVSRQVENKNAFTFKSAINKSLKSWMLQQ